MDQPDFSSYNEDQLRQIASRLDSNRFPERRAEVERRLAAFDQQRAGPPIVAPGIERFQLSAPRSVWAHDIFPALLLAAVLLCFIGALISRSGSLGIWLVFGAMVIGAGIFQHQLSRMLTMAEIAEGVFIAHRDGETELIPLADIVRMETTSADQPTVIVYRRSPGKFGDTLEFLPAPELEWDTLPGKQTLEELIRRAQLAGGKILTSTGSSG